MWLRDKAGVDSEEFFFNREVTIRELVDAIRNRHKSLDKIISNIFSSDNPLIILVNGVKKSPDQLLRDNDEVVLLPPVSGG